MQARALLADPACVALPVVFRLVVPVVAVIALRLCSAMVLTGLGGPCLCALQGLGTRMVLRLCRCVGQHPAKQKSAAEQSVHGFLQTCNVRRGAARGPPVACILPLPI
jgi:hypothetical protein